MAKPTNGADQTFHETELDIDDSAFIAPGATLVGKVRIAANASVWYHAVLRGDLEPVSVGERSNVQDGSVIHVDRGFPTVIGADVTIGHRAIVHGALLEDGCLIGMGAIVLSGAIVRRGALVAAGSVVSENFEVPPDTLVAGTPARPIRPLTDEVKQRMREGCETYVTSAARYRDGTLGGGPRGRG